MIANMNQMYHRFCIDFNWKISKSIFHSWIWPKQTPKKWEIPSFKIPVCFSSCYFFIFSLKIWFNAPKHINQTNYIVTNLYNNFMHAFWQMFNTLFAHSIPQLNFFRVHQYQPTLLLAVTSIYLSFSLFICVFRIVISWICFAERIRHTIHIYNSWNELQLHFIAKFNWNIHLRKWKKQQRTAFKFQCKMVLKNLEFAYLWLTRSKSDICLGVFAEKSELISNESICGLLWMKCHMSILQGRRLWAIESLSISQWKWRLMWFCLKVIFGWQRSSLTHIQTQSQFVKRRFGRTISKFGYLFDQTFDSVETAFVYRTLIFVLTRVVHLLARTHTQLNSNLLLTLPVNVVYMKPHWIIKWCNH